MEDEMIIHLFTHSILLQLLYGLLPTFTPFLLDSFFWSHHPCSVKRTFKKHGKRKLDHGVDKQPCRNVSNIFHEVGPPSGVSICCIVTMYLQIHEPSEVQYRGV
jgi:hypothetical protein